MTGFFSPSYDPYFLLNHENISKLQFIFLLFIFHEFFMTVSSGFKIWVFKHFSNFFNILHSCSWISYTSSIKSLFKNLDFSNVIHLKEKELKYFLSWFKLWKLLRFLCFWVASSNNKCPMLHHKKNNLLNLYIFFKLKNRSKKHTIHWVAAGWGGERKG